MFKTGERFLHVMARCARRCPSEKDGKLETPAREGGARGGKQRRAEIKTARPGCFEQLIQPLWRNNRLLRWPGCYSVLLHAGPIQQGAAKKRGQGKREEGEKGREIRKRVREREGKPREAPTEGPTDTFSVWSSIMLLLGPP